MNSISTPRFVSLALIACATLGGCAGSAKHTPLETAYEKACRSPRMTPAAGREAFWCWRTAGVRSYEEWIAFERAAKQGEERRLAQSRQRSLR